MMKGTEAIGEGAVQAGCRCYFGYPITPQNEIPEYMSRRMEEVGGVFLQGESEIASINMVLGAAAAGMRAMTSSSSPGISLKQEGLSFLASLELPAVVVNINRGGPGLGNIAPSQGDYYQATRGGGHGDYRMPVYAPATVQELYDITMEAFDVADLYRTPVMILGDGMMGQIVEPVVMHERKKIDLPPKDYILDGAQGRPSRIIKSLILDVKLMEEHNWKLKRKYDLMRKDLPRHDEFMTEDAKMVIVAYGTAARIAKGAVKRVRSEGLQVGLLRPVTLWPFPEDALRNLSKRVKLILVFEMSTGQMIDDVKLAVGGRIPCEFYGRPGGVVASPQEIARIIERHWLQREIS
ncbi:MAG TPA: 3-methyl-2-oxobutanoate dehydrogenase subunit VorB [Deltaproteobacteria bacterium]|nr:3-methyl-2-oxobutanoate dehydrogenase subunit VorB [Deltaproteobacteria bacterium]HPP80938.1 3-methyl-2-oxobutanoate dehydrogenase subunit VorB [Deltaproteobacteria bacterium]